MTKLNFNLLDEDSATQAVEIISRLADENGIDWALVGGLAMNLYGSDRLTKDIDIIADKLLPMSQDQIVGKLKQGGERYLTETGKKTVAVDWIIRDDEFKILFKQALQESVKINDIPVLTPEWLVILKFIAGRFKDREDAVFLLSKEGLVDRKLIKQKIIDLFGKPAWGLAKHSYQRWFDIADNKSLEDRRNEAAGYIDS
ncbi:MAG: nucleotidyl transferase AbiEii/AbiGii toxin family protein [Aridibacter sp.]